MSYKLTRDQQKRAAEIRAQDWSDAPFRRDRAGHRWEDDSPSKQTVRLDQTQTENLLWNVVVNAAQVYAYEDPNFDVYVFGEACGLPRHMLYNNRGGRDGGLEAGIRKSSADGSPSRPGPYVNRADFR